MRRGWELPSAPFCFVGPAGAASRWGLAPNLTVVPSSSESDAGDRIPRSWLALDRPSTARGEVACGGQTK